MLRRYVVGVAPHAPGESPHFRRARPPLFGHYRADLYGGYYAAGGDALCHIVADILVVSR